MSQSVVVGDTTFTIPDGAIILSSSSHPLFGTEDIQVSGSLMAVTPETASVVRASIPSASSTSTNSTTAPRGDTVTHLGKSGKRTKTER